MQFCKNGEKIYFYLQKKCDILLKLIEWEWKSNGLNDSLPKNQSCWKWCENQSKSCEWIQNLGGSLSQFMGLVTYNGITMKYIIGCSNRMDAWRKEEGVTHILAFVWKMVAWHHQLYISFSCLPLYCLQPWSIWHKNVRV